MTDPAALLSPDSERADRRAIVIGLAFWALFAALAVVLRGVRWDFTYEYAEALLGAAPYPPGHPYLLFLRAAPSLQNDLAVALYWLSPNPLVLNGITNFFFLLATVWPPFLLTALVVRRAVWAHAVTIFFLLGIHLSFDPSYPQFIWPNEMSTGHIPTGYVLILLAVLVAARWRLGFFLLGVMPCLHVAQMPPLLLVLPLLLAWHWRNGKRKPILRALPYGLAGLAITVAVFAVRTQSALPVPDTGAFVSTLDPYTVWHNYTFNQDAHRGFPLTGNSHILLAAAVLFGAGLALVEYNKRRRLGAAFWLWCYIVATAAVVWTITFIHRTLGADTPGILIIWLPYRLAIHVPPIAVALIVCALTGGLDAKERPLPGTAILVPAALLYGLVNPWIESIVGRDAYYHYFIYSECVFYGLLGAASAVVFSALRPIGAARIGWLAVCALAVAVLVRFHHYAPLCIAGGFAGGLALLLTDTRKDDSPAWLRRLTAPFAVGTLVALNLGLLLHTEFAARESLPVSTFLRNVSTTLAARGEPHAMILGPPDQLLLQAKTGHPFLAHMGIPEWISYMPEIGPPTAKLYGDIFGTDFSKPPIDPTSDHAHSWEAVWEKRTAAEWRRLGKEYGFHYVLAPPGMKLHLPQLIDAPEGELFVIDLPVGA